MPGKLSVAEMFVATPGSSTRPGARSPRVIWGDDMSLPPVTECSRVRAVPFALDSASLRASGLQAAVGVDHGVEVGVELGEGFGGEFVLRGRGESGRPRQGVDVVDAAY